MPTRRPQAAEVNAREARWHRDMDAYKALRNDGVQPKNIDGSARLQAGAETVMEVEAGQVLTPKQRRTATSVLEDLRAA